MRFFFGAVHSTLSPVQVFSKFEINKNTAKKSIEKYDTSWKSNKRKKREKIDTRIRMEQIKKKSNKRHDECVANVVNQMKTIPLNIALEIKYSDYIDEIFLECI